MTDHTDHDHLDDGTCVAGYLVPPPLRDSALYQALRDEAMTMTQPVPYIEPRNGYGLTALITGICSVLLSLIPILWFLGGPLGVVAVGMGLANRGRLHRGTATNGKSTVWGIVLGALGIVIAVIGFIIVQVAVNKLNHDIQQIPTTVPTFPTDFST